MAEQIKYLQFKGLLKKEEILFKSFLNLVKNELSYQIIVLKEKHEEANAPDLLIMGEDYVFGEDELELSDLPNIVIGDDHDCEASGYIARPVQWSEFRHCLMSLRMEAQGEVEAKDRVLPDEIELDIPQELEATEEAPAPESGAESAPESAPESVPEKKEDFSAEGEYEYELDRMSVDYHSFTNSDYVKVADDVKQFKTPKEVEVLEPVILVTDEESSSVNSVLVLETNSVDAWDFNESEVSISKNINEKEELDWESQESGDEEVVLDKRAGFEIRPEDKYWQEDNEIIIDNKPLLFIKTAREMVYSHTEPGRWPAMLQRRALTRLPLEKDWRPHSGLGVYPITSLIWVNTLISETESLFDDLDEDAEYLLERWPNFDLLELDNVLLKLCTMLFVRPESVSSLAEKSGYGRSTIRGLVNACHEMGYLKTPAEIDVEKLTPISSDEGMLGRIKDVFR